MEKKNNKIDIDKIDLEQEKDKVTDFPGSISFPHHLGSSVIKPEDQGKIKGKAMAAMKDQTERQMHQLYQQMQVLARQANQIKKRVEISERIYLSQINFEPIIGHTYYLYERNDGKDILSMINPEEWGKNMPFKKHLASVRLLSDHTWELVQDLANLDD
ncbi:MAG: DUF2452 domain-containing protein [Candidatus Cyclobacteriaceae bacterium M3_2C_046]